ncbi:MAG: alpha/beta hydrolase [Verrucomicrobiota bacterium]
MPSAKKRNPAHLPIVYLRGYAATQGEINSTVDDPFYGFNIGSTHVRVGARGDPVQYFFESPLVRLISDYGYRDVYQGEKQSLPHDVSDPLKTIWIFRYYDATSDTFQHKPRRWTIEESAGELRTLIAEIKKQTGAPRVHLVAHSMGGLVCRSLIQKIYPENDEHANDHIARFFTFGTPHGGIQFRAGLGWAEWLRDALGAMNSDDFGRDRMYAYLAPGVRPGTDAPDHFLQHQIPPSSFNLDNVFSMIGTNAPDYDAAAGLSRKGVGPQSDGLVQIGAAYVKGSHRAYVHRSHSGRYGIVNSEEAFQNLERFLFGNIQAEIQLDGLGALPSPQVESLQLDVRISVRGLPVFMNEQTRDRFCPIVLNDTDDEPVPSQPLFTQFMNSQFAPKGGKSRFAVALALKRLPVKKGEIDYDGLLHGIPNWSDTLIVDVVFGTRPRLEYRWLLADGEIAPRPVELEPIEFKGRQARITLPKSARDHLGNKASLLINSYNWTLD